MNVAALIVTYNRLPQLQISLCATLRMAFDTVVVVNNASTDGTGIWLEGLNDPRLHVLPQSVNSGGAGGFSAGLDYLETLDGWTHVCLFDDDAWPASGWLEALANEPHADGYCSDVRDLDWKRCAINVPFTRLPATLAQTFMYGWKPHLFRPGHSRVSVVSLSFVGACLTRPWLPALQQALVPSLFLYFDDLSAGVALARQGANLVWSPALRFHHAVVSQHNVPACKRYYATRNLLWLSRLPAGPLWHPTVTALRLAIQLYFSLKSTPRTPALKSWWRGIKDGIAGPEIKPSDKTRGCRL